MQEDEDINGDLISCATAHRVQESGVLGGNYQGTLMGFTVMCFVEAYFGSLLLLWGFSVR